VEEVVAYLAAIHDELTFQSYDIKERYKEYVDYYQKINSQFHIKDSLSLL